MIISVLSLPRFLRLRRNRAVAAPQDVAEPRVPVPAPVEPAWVHRPPQAFVWADNCGWCRKPIPADSRDPEFCTTRCNANWLLETNGPTYGPELPPIQGCQRPPIPDRPADPPWLAQIVAWDKAKTDRVADERRAA